MLLDSKLFFERNCLYLKFKTKTLSKIIFMRTDGTMVQFLYNISGQFSNI